MFKLSNNKSPAEAFAQVKGKLAYDTRETERSVVRHELPYFPNPHFPVMTMSLMRAAIYAMGQDWQEEYTRVIFDAMWVDAKKWMIQTLCQRSSKRTTYPYKKLSQQPRCPK